MSNGKKIHGVVVESLHAIRDYAGANGLSLSSVRDLLHILDLMDHDDKVLDSLGAIDQQVTEQTEGVSGAASHLMRMAKSHVEMGSSAVDCKTHLYDLVDHIVNEAYCGQAESAETPGACEQ